MLLFYMQKRNATSFRSLNHYEMLGVNKSASHKEIKVAYYKKCKELHPDNNKNDPSSHNKFIAINRAYSVLSESSSRRDYDQSLNNPTASAAVYRNGGPTAQQRRAAYTAYNPANAEHFYRTFYRERYSESESEFEKYIRNKYYQNQGGQTSQREFTSPIRVMITIVIGLGFVDYFLVNHIYNQDVTSLRNANRYSIYDKDLAATLNSEIAKGDEAKIDEQIRQFKEQEFRVRKPVYKNLQDAVAENNNSNNEATVVSLAVADTAQTTEQPPVAPPPPPPSPSA